WLPIRRGSRRRRPQAARGSCRGSARGTPCRPMAGLASRAMPLASVELCAGAGGQALGLEAAGFEHLALVEVDPHACDTLRRNRPRWNVIEDYLENFDIATYGKPDLLAAGVPCPPFSMAGKQLGSDDERDLFPRALELVERAEPRAVLFENVRGLLAPA